MLIKNFTSQVKGDLNALSFDDYLSDEYIYEKGLSNFEMIIKRESDNRKLWNDSKLFKTIECFEMEQVSANICNISIPCKTVCRSVKPLPELFSTSYGSLLQVTDIFGEKVFKETIPSRYTSSINRGVKSKNTYYWIQDGYLIIPGEDCIGSVQIRGMFKNQIEIGKCQSMLDVDFPIPKYLESTIIDLTVQKIFATKKRIPLDENTDLNTNLKA